ncbi:MAG: hypothetical protein AB8H47_15430 [Bacteroidia bacterium]
MGAFFAILRNPVFILSLIFFGSLWYFYQQLMTTFHAFRKARKISERKENRENNLWQEYETWRIAQSVDLPTISFAELNDLQVRERAQEALIAQLQNAESDPTVKAWRLSLQDARFSVLEERKKIQKYEQDWDSMQNRFPYNVLIGLLNLKV